MKINVLENERTTLSEFDIEVLVVQDVSKLSESEKHPIPTGEVIPGEKGAYISEQMLADYESFVYSIEDLLIDYYGLELTYYNYSEDNSYYYNFLAKDSEGKVRLKFRFRLRISNHNAHRSKGSQSQKKAEFNSPELVRHLGNINPKTLRPFVKQIIINNELYSTYEEAYSDICEKLDRWVDYISNG